MFIRKEIILFLLLNCLLLSCSGSLNILTEKVSDEKISLSTASNFILLSDIKINNSKEEHQFIFDTGSNVNVIDESLQNKFNFPVVGFMKITDIDRKIKFSKLVRIDSLKIGTIQLIDFKAVVMNIKNECDEYHGIFGNNFSKEFSWYFNPKNAYAVINPSEKYTKNLHRKINFKTKRNLPYVNGKVRKKEYRFLFDTGAFSCNIPLKDRAMYSKDTTFYTHEFLWKSPSSNKTKSYEIDSFLEKDIYIDGAKFTNDVRFLGNNVPSIGLDFFEDNVFFIDFESKYILFENPQEYEESEIQPKILFDLNNKEIIISNIFSKKGAFEGLILGDKIIMINDVITSDADCELIRKINNIDKIYYLKIEREQGIIDLYFD